MVLSSIFGRNKTENSEEFSIVIDGGSLAAYDSGQSLQSGEQLEILQSLSQISKEQDWSMEALFIGEELRQVGQGGMFMNVRVFYTPDQANRPRDILARVSELQKQGAVLVITSDPNLEERVHDCGGAVVRSSSFKKCFPNRFKIRQRPQSRLMRRRSQITQSQLQEEQQQEEGDGINDLVDLV